ncbi:hypothetical protein NIES208_06885 [[Limnothrix rosea] IAM M-220]|nr:hypothetical protein NIES208_06885 [[Limnothrix rosea] IAM M-220]
MAGEFSRLSLLWGEQSKSILHRCGGIAKGWESISFASVGKLRRVAIAVRDAVHSNLQQQKTVVLLTDRSMTIINILKMTKSKYIKIQDINSILKKV